LVNSVLLDAGLPFIISLLFEGEMLRSTARQVANALRRLNGREL
jgi:hypothetical protein